LPTMEDGVLVHGMFMDAYGWDDTCAVESNEPHAVCGAFRAQPLPHASVQDLRSCRSSVYYRLLYDFILMLPSNQPSDYWISKGSALLCQLNE
ncbi:hypothetical protein cypCar_00004893, partial [Cyprinus carpio]